MIIQRIVSDLLLSNMYIIEEEGHMIVIDPFQKVSCPEGTVVDKIILTHEHYDHISGVNIWKEKTGAKVLCSAACAKNIANPRKSMVRYFDVFCEMQTWVKLEKMPELDYGYVCEADEIFEDEMLLEWMGHQIQLFSLPGHSQGSIGILIDEKDFFSGDSLIKEQTVELRFPGGSEELWKMVSLPRLAKLPNGVQVHPGHFEEFLYEKGAL